MDKLDIHGSKISVLSPDKFIKKVFELSQTSAYVCFANVHMVMEAHNDASFRQVLNAAAIAAPDGRPISWFIEHFHKTEQDRICGMDYMPILMREAAERNYTVFFYGSTHQVLDKILERTSVQFPLLKIAGTYSPPFRELTKKEDEQIIEMINNSNADLIFIALGCPKQEKWMSNHVGKVKGCMLGVGQAFLTFAGYEKRLPQWARRFALEWLYRLWQEPGRLWKRYLLTNTKFVYMTLKLVLHNFFRKALHIKMLQRRSIH